MAIRSCATLPVSPPVFAVALLSGAALGYEILLTRLFAIIQWHHFAYMMISAALLGYGAAGTVVTLMQRWLQARFTRVFSAAAILFGLGAVAGFLSAQRVPFNPLAFAWDPREIVYLVMIYLLLFMPFFFAAIALCLSFSCYGRISHRLYSFDITGAACGSLAIIGVLFALSPSRALSLIGAMGFVVAGVAWLECRMKSYWPAVLFFTLGIAVPLALPLSWSALKLSEYKGLSQTLRITGTRILAQTSSPLGFITVVESPRIPFRYAPGLSLNAPLEPPAQLGIFTDGEGFSALTRFDGQLEPLIYLDHLTSALPYHLLNQPEVLVLGAGTGSDVLQALYHRVRSVDAVELNPQIVELVQKRYRAFSGRPYSAPGVQLHVAEARGFVAASPKRYELIQVALVDTFGASSAGLYALSESYLYTIEAFREYLQHLKPNGLLSVTRWVQLPPRDILKLFATAIEILEQQRVQHPERQLALIYGWKTATLLVKNGEFNDHEIALLREFCRARSFDVGYYPGMEVSEANRYNLLDQAYYFEAATALLGERRDEFMERYKFTIAPATDDRPYFFHFFKWRTLPEILRLKERGGLPLLEWGYPVLIVTLLQAVMVSLLLVLLPLWLARKLFRDAAAPPGFTLRTAVYFTAIGLAFMFIEIAFIQRFILFLSHPLYAIAVVLCAFLLFAGLGSRFSARIKEQRSVVLVVGSIGAIAVLYLILLPVLFQHLFNLQDIYKVAVSIALIAPLAFPMGMLFPLGLAGLANTAQALLPWAWGINACASVVAAILATALAIHFGFTAVVIAALLLYGLAAMAFGSSFCR